MCRNLAESVFEGFYTCRNPAESVFEGFYMCRDPAESVFEGFYMCRDPAESVFGGFYMCRNPAESVFGGFYMCRDPPKDRGQRTKIIVKAPVLRLHYIYIHHPLKAPSFNDNNYCTYYISYCSFLQ